MLPNSQCWLVWDKGQRDFSLADGELAWTSFDKALRIFTYARGQQHHDEIRKHPTQKPLKLMEWCIYNNSKESDLIFDGFAGSFSVAHACINTNRNFICIEKDEEYYKMGLERVKKAQEQEKLSSWF